MGRVVKSPKAKEKGSLDDQKLKIRSLKAKDSLCTPDENFHQNRISDALQLNEFRRL